MLTPQMDLRHLRYFVAVADEGHITRAAELLGIQQPPLSQQIQALEQELGVQLFHRKPRGVDLTDAGRALLDDARAILAQVETAVATVRRTARGEQGTDRRRLYQFGGLRPIRAPGDPVVPGQLPVRLADCWRRRAQVNWLTALRTQQLDVAFVRSPVADPAGLVVEFLFEEELLVALPSGHPLCPTDTDTDLEDMALPLAALALERFILYRRPLGPGLYDTIIAACHGAGFSPEVGQEAPRILSTLNLVAAGLGVSLVPASLQRLQMDGVVYRRLTDSPHLKAPINVAYRNGEHSAAVHTFIALVHQSAADLRTA